MNTPTISDTFSWRRVMAIGRYYYPALRTQMIIYPLISLVTGIILFFFVKSVIWGFFGSILSLTLQFMLYLSPIVFARKQTRPIETLLPALGSEKATFILGYSLIIVPILTFGPELIVYHLLHWIFPGITDLYSIYHTQFSIDNTVNILGYAQYLVPLTTCLFVIFRRTTNRITMGFVWTFVALIGETILIAIFSAIAFIHQLNQKDTIFFNSPENLSSMDLINTMIPAITIFFIICAIYVVIMNYFTARSICKKQI